MYLVKRHIDGNNIMGSFSLADGIPSVAVAVLLFLLFSILLSGCTGLGKVADKSYLYTGNKINIDSTKNLSDPSAAKSELKSLIINKPNKKFLWMRPRMVVYVMVS